MNPGEMRGAAEDMVNVLITLRDSLNREGGIFDQTHEDVPFGERNPSGYVYDLRLQAQEALRRAKANLMVEAGVVRKLVDAIFKATAAYEGTDASADEMFKRLDAQLHEIQTGGRMRAI